MLYAKADNTHLHPAGNEVLILDLMRDGRKVGAQAGCFKAGRMGMGIQGSTICAGGGDLEIQVSPTITMNSRWISRS